MSKEQQEELMYLLKRAQIILMEHKPINQDNSKAIVLLEDIMHLVDVEK